MTALDIEKLCFFIFFYLSKFQTNSNFASSKVSSSMERDALVTSKGIGTNIEALTRGDDFLGINCYIIRGSLTQGDPSDFTTST
jgi:hypothetical protein